MNLLINIYYKSFIKQIEQATKMSEHHTNLKFKVLQDLTEEERVKALSSIEEGLDPIVTEPVTDCRG